MKKMQSFGSYSKLNFLWKHYHNRKLNRKKSEKHILCSLDTQNRSNCCMAAILDIGMERF